MYFPILPPETHTLPSKAAEPQGQSWFGGEVISWSLGDHRFMLWSRSQQTFTVEYCGLQKLHKTIQK